MKISNIATQILQFIFYAMEIRNELQQKQLQQMSPVMLQSLRILQLPRLELEQFISQELQSNPFLEQSQNVNCKENFNNNNEFSDYTSNISVEEKCIQSGNFNENYNNFGRDLSGLQENQSIESYILDQVIDVDDGVKTELISLIGQLDEHGFLSREALLELGFCEKIDNSKSNFVEFFSKNLHKQEAYILLRTLMPRGIGAVNLRDCLLLQLEENDILFGVVAEYFEDIIHQRFVKLQRKLRCSQKELSRILQPIKNLNFSPLSALNLVAIPEIKPDIFFAKEQGKWTATIGETKNIYLGDNYKKLLTKKLNQDDKKFFNEYRSRAQTLIMAIAQRKQTLKKIAEYILHFQWKFLESGVEFLHPHSIKQVAEILEINQSTLSRAANKKYVEVGRKILPLKSFFSHGNSNSLAGQNLIKEKIKEIVGSGHGVGMSDEKIAKEMQQNGLIISRRLVAKYRKELNIPASSARKIFGYKVLQ